MIAILVVVFFGLVVGGTGPAYQDWRAARRALQDRPTARLLPPGAGYDLKFAHGPVSRTEPTDLMQ